MILCGPGIRPGPGWYYADLGDAIKMFSASVTVPRYIIRDCSTSVTEKYKNLKRRKIQTGLEEGILIRGHWGSSPISPISIVDICGYLDFWIWYIKVHWGSYPITDQSIADMCGYLSIFVDICGYLAGRPINCGYLDQMLNISCRRGR